VVIRKQQNKGTIDMNRRFEIVGRFFLALVVASTLGACGSNDTGSPPPVDANASVNIDAGAGVDVTAAEAEPSSATVDATAAEAGPSSATVDASPNEAGASQSAAPNGIVVVNSDYQSSSVSFLDRDGNLLKDGCFNSGSGPQGFTMTLSGDVVLPSQQTIGGDVVIVDRQNAALTWLDPATCAPLRQLAVGTGFASNPHDVVMLSASKAYVSRFEENAEPTPAPGDFDEGDDLLIVDPSQPKILGRIDLKPYAPAGANILPRADRALLAEGKVFVSLNGITADYGSYGVGRVVVVDPTLDQVVDTIDIAGAKDCGALSYLAAERKLLVACDGAYGPEQADTSAIVAIDLSVAPPTVVSLVGAAAVGGLLFSNSSVAALSENNVAAVTLGDLSNSPPDRLWSLSMTGGQPVKVFDSAEGFSLGAVLADVDRGRIVVADGTTTSAAFVRMFDLVAGTLSATKTTNADPSHNLPPRGLSWY
jgi:hypothetical protein